MELYDVMRTAFACRSWTDEPVEDEVLHRILDNARFAPSGGNRQGVRVIVLRDRSLREDLVPHIRALMNHYVAQRDLGEPPLNTILASGVDAAAEAAARADQADHANVAGWLHAPVWLLVTVDLSVVASMDSRLDRIGVISGASVYPFVWNVLLAARNEGLGGVLTTGVADAEPEIQQLLGIPAHHAVAALLPIGHPTKQLTRLSRLPVEEIATVDRFDGEPFRLG